MRVEIIHAKSERVCKSVWYNESEACIRVCRQKSNGFSVNMGLH